MEKYKKIALSNTIFTDKAIFIQHSDLRNLKAIINVLIFKVCFF